ncbi:MAG: TIGR04086 family membrane protein [Oscillospiraceae bacterium]|nr:TIGR04086 family membrane protein [Oscillospiraceae bacterium]
MRVLQEAVLLIGIPISVLGMVCGALLATVMDLPAWGYGVLGTLALMAGCFYAGWFAGKRLRRHGLRWGLLCGAVVTTLWLLFAMVVTQSVGIPLLLLFTLPAGMVGGVLGVNGSAPIAGKRSHRMLHHKQKLMALADRTQKQRYYHPKNVESRP